MTDPNIEALERIRDNPSARDADRAKAIELLLRIESKLQGAGTLGASPEVVVLEFTQADIDAAHRLAEAFTCRRCGHVNTVADPGEAPPDIGYTAEDALERSERA